MPTPFEVLVTGDILAAVLQVYTDVLGFWVYVIGLMALLAGIYYKSKNITAVSVVGLLVATALSSRGVLPPEGTAAIQTIIILAVAGSLYVAFKSVR